MDGTVVCCGKINNCFLFIIFTARMGRMVGAKAGGVMCAYGCTRPTCATAGGRNAWGCDVGLQHRMGAAELDYSYVCCVCVLLNANRHACGNGFNACYRCVCCVCVLLCTTRACENGCRMAGAAACDVHYVVCGTPLLTRLADGCVGCTSVVCGTRVGIASMVGYSCGIAVCVIVACVREWVSNGWAGYVLAGSVCCCCVYAM
jgi:hypothetical protein